MRTSRAVHVRAVVGGLALLCLSAALAAACGTDYGAAAEVNDAAVESGLADSGVEGSASDATSDARDARDGEAGPAVDAGPPCPYDGGCPCIQPSCKPTVLGSYALADVMGTANDGDNLYLGAGVDGLVAVAFANGSLTTLYKPSVATSKVDRLVLSKSEFFLIEETDSIYPDIVAVTRASPHTGRIVMAQAHFNGGAAVNRALAANDTRIYWNEVAPSTVKSALFDGGDVRSTNGAADVLIATADAVYATNSYVRRYSTDLATLEAVGGPRQGRALAVGGGSVFWTGQFDDSVYRAPAAFADDAGVPISSAQFLDELQLGDDGFLYFQNSDFIFRCRLPACEGGPATLAASPSGALTAVVGGNAYVVDSPPVGTLVVYRVPLHD